MIQKVIKCGIIGGFILFIWSAVSWTVLPWQRAQIGSFSNEKEVTTVIQKNISGSGIYVLPNLSQYQDDPDALAAAKDRMAEGPYVVAAIAADGRNPHMGGPMVGGLILKIVAACLVTWLLLQTGFRDFNKCVKFVTVTGIVIAILATIPYALWFAYPGNFVIASMIEIIFGWFFAGLAIAKMIK